MIKIFVWLLLLIPTYIYSQSAEEILAGIQKKFQATNNFTSQFIQKATSPLDNKAYVSSGKFVYQRKDHFRVELKNQLIISDSETLWNYNKKLNRVLINTLENDPSSFSLEKYIMQYPSLCSNDLQTDTSGQKVVVLSPSDEELEFNSVKIWPGDDFTITKIEVEDLSGSIFSIELNSIKLNQIISNSLFSFNPPEGTQVIDLR